MNRVGRPRVAVLGAAGQTGAALLPELVARGAAVRAVVRPGASVSLPEGVERAEADFADVEALTEALSGIDAVYHIPPTYSPHEVAFGRNVMKAATRVGGVRLVYHSVMHAETPDMPHHWRKWQVEELLRESALSWTIVRPAMYAQTALAFLNRARTRLRLPFSPDSWFTPIDVADVGRAAAIVLVEGGHERQTYTLAGAERLTMRQMAERMADAWGHDVSVQRWPSWLVARVAARRYDHGSRALLKAMFAHYSAAGFEGPADDLRRLLKGEPTGFAATMTRCALSEQ